MSHTFQVSDEQYSDIAAYAARLGVTSESLFQAWVEGITDWVEAQRIVREKREKKEDEEEYDEKLVSQHPLLQLARRISAGENAQDNWIEEQVSQKEQEKGSLDILKIAGMFSIGEPDRIDRHNDIFGGWEVL
jgi:hypothetical protein